MSAGNHGSSRQLLSTSGCSSQPDWMKKGGVLLYLAAVCYLFLGISIVCDEYFVKSLSAICSNLNVPDDIGGSISLLICQLMVFIGATFMAAGSSAPELFASFVALANTNASNDIGVSTIVGSAVFNILCIIGITALYSKQMLSLDYRPVIRDCSFYAVAIGTIVFVFYDGKIYWWEGLISVVFYVVYVTVVGSCRPTTNDDLTERQILYRQVSDDISIVEKMKILSFHGSFSPPILRNSHYTSPTNNHTTLNLEENGSPFYGSLASDISFAQSTADPLNEQTEKIEGEETQDLFKWPESRMDQVFWVIAFPWNLAFSCTVPNCMKERWNEWYMLTFINSIVWIGLISWFMVEWTADIGCILGIPSVVMGVTLLAAGTSIPDALSSVAVAQDGKGDMAVANAVGSNIFDIWLGLGLPWLFVIPFVGETGNYGKYLSINNDQLIPNILILLGVLFFYLLLIACSNWKLYAHHGYVFLFLYFIYAMYNCIVIGILDSEPKVS